MGRFQIGARTPLRHQRRRMAWLTVGRKAGQAAGRECRQQQTPRRKGSGEERPRNKRKNRAVVSRETAVLQTMRFQPKGDRRRGSLVRHGPTKKRGAAETQELLEMVGDGGREERRREDEAVYGGGTGLERKIGGCAVRYGTLGKTFLDR